MGGLGAAPPSPLDPKLDSRAKSAFDAVVDLAGAEREVALQRACGDDLELRARVESLLEAAERDGEFLSDPEPAANDSPALGLRIGPYRLLERIGEGGFGIVYRAEQSEPVRRLVALKVLKAGMDSRAVVARFEQERQALALMDHPNIAKVFDAGTSESGQPYFAMELVEGEPITTFCDRRSLDLRARLGLLLQVCRAVQHAHTKGILHRDIKPANVLVGLQDGTAVSRVIDFGIAKAVQGPLTDHTVFTEHLQLIGTPQYMSPEQAAGDPDIDTRSDVYALGVLLYELLTGGTPVDPATLRSAPYGQFQRVLLEADPPAPSSRLARSGETLAHVAAARGASPQHLCSSVRGELDWITLRALERERGRRYGSAGELAADLERHLAGEPVLAAPPSAGYRARKLLRRHRLAVSVGAVVSLALVAGAALALWQASVAAEQRDAAHLAARAAEAARAEAERRRLETEAVALFEAERLRQIDVEAMGRRILADLLVDAEQGMRRASVSPEEFAERRARLEALLADVNATNIARSTLDASIFEGARSAIELQFQDQPLVRGRLLLTLGEILLELGLYERADEMLVPALEIRRASLGDLHRDTLWTIGALGNLRGYQDRWQEAEVLFEEALRGRRQTLGELHVQTLVAQNNVGIARLYQGRLREAEVLLVDLLEKMRQTVGPDSPDALRMSANLGGLKMELGEPAQAEPYFRDALERGRRVFGPDHFHVISTTSNLALALERMGRLDEAEEQYRDALARARRALGEEHPDTLLYKSNLGFLLASRGQLEEAQTWTLEALEARRRLLGPRHADTLQSLHNAGVLLAARGDAIRAEALQREALEARLSSFDGAHWSVLQTRDSLADLFLREGRHAEAEQQLLTAHHDVLASPQATPSQLLERIQALIRLYEDLNPAQAEHWRAERTRRMTAGAQ